MSTWEIVFDVVVGILVLLVGGLGVFAVALSYHEERLARRERRERARIREAQEEVNSPSRGN